MLWGIHHGCLANDADVLASKGVQLFVELFFESVGTCMHSLFESAGASTCPALVQSGTCNNSKKCIFLVTAEKTLECHAQNRKKILIELGLYLFKPNTHFLY